MIINIRGTSGAGKSTLVRSVMEGRSARALVGEDGKTTNGYRVDYGGQSKGGPNKDLYVVGRYTTDCGGCDTVKTADRVCNLVRGYSLQGSVLFEGVIVSDTYERYLKLDHELTKLGQTFVWAFLDTPVEVCIERVKARRLASGNEKPLDETNTRTRWQRIRRVREKARSAGRRVMDLDHRDPLPQVLELLRGER